MPKKDMIPCPICRGSGKVGQFRCKGCGGKKEVELQIAERIQVDYLSYYVDTVIDAVEKVTGIGYALVTDRSSIWDFLIDDDEAVQAAKVKLMSDDLGVPVELHDEIVKVAQRLRDL